MLYYDSTFCMEADILDELEEYLDGLGLGTFKDMFFPLNLDWVIEF